MGRSELTLSSAALDALAGNTWPGNIRELENVVHNAVLLAPGPEIQPSDLRLNRQDQRTQSIVGGTMEDELRAIFTRCLASGEPDLFARASGTLVATAFDLSNANQIRAAKSLGLSRNAMRTQLARLGLIAGRPSRHAGEA